MNPTVFDELERAVSVFSPSEVIFISPFDETTVRTICQYSSLQCNIHSINIDESNDFTDKKDKLFTKGANINIIENENKNMEAQDSTKFQVEYIDTIEPIKSGIVYKTSVSSSQNSEKKIEKAYSYKFTPTSKEKFKDYNENRYFFLNN